MMKKKRLPLILGITIIAIVVFISFAFLLFKQNHNSPIPASDIAKTWADDAIILSIMLRLQMELRQNSHWIMDIW